MEKILVTGGAGYIGSHFIRILKQNNYSPVVIDNLVNGHRQAIPDVDLIEEDLRETHKMLDILKTKGPFIAVVHFASFIEVSLSVKNPLKFFDNNIVSTIKLLQMAENLKIPNIIFSSTASVYGTPVYNPIDEKHPRNPFTPYGSSKYFMEQIIQYTNIKHCILRYFNAAGADPEGNIGEDHDPETHLIPIILKKALAIQKGEKTPPIKLFGDDYNTIDGTCVRDYIHIDDIAQAHILALKYLQDKNSSDVFNLGNGKGYSVKQVIEIACKVTGISIPYEVAPRRPGDPDTLVSSAKKAEKILGWKPRYAKLEEIIKHAWNWHLNHPQGFQN